MLCSQGSGGEGQAVLKVQIQDAISHLGWRLGVTPYMAITKISQGCKGWATLKLAQGNPMPSMPARVAKTLQKERKTAQRST